ncbi:SAM-dependent methyltransferase [Brevirhabdus pacifica]|uniref:SAM-dependent methyltransferase n=1 Tax=Brevirhabdus pacifica TaxID=1267768 RepID=A0A1U7DK67_9RHOB|nr:cyclopropane-fatty-acyl-phospholipid synthase family protein [Brevirhabdus pacifica]APX90394.1 SAM-dependent methyltransferase [Brevirhabdus pacifica]OWU78581.1 cyclopropane-fatty-acyl-phospholipid synthase [Loktanella sp. 22II-4b]PJJ85516.1 cyclopropane-fatty-acyl-phospholipid synthase [Brevirhabdus pacifica]
MWISLLDQMLGRLFRQGRLRVVFPDGQERSYGTGPQKPMVVRLNDPALPRRLVLNPDLALGEAYMDQTLTIDGDDLEGFLALLIANRSAGGRSWILDANLKAQKAMRRIRQRNTARSAQSNVAHHYDLSGRLYELFLDEDRQYSCAYFRHPDDTLEEAQAQKKAHIAAKLLLRPGMRVLDIGCGWGGMALTLARDYGVRVVGLTLSEEQLGVARRRAEEAGLAEQIEFRLQDYRAVAERFDRVVSVGMFEHVGVPHYRDYFRKVQQLLVPDGIALIHTIGRGTPPGATSPWIAKYIFPGGYVPAMSEVLEAIEKEDLVTTDVEVWRMHYAETLRHWRMRFDENVEQIRALYDERFVRMFRYYMLASEMTFRHARQSVFQFQLSPSMNAVPLTRDYLYGGGEDQAMTRAAE